MTRFVIALVVMALLVGLVQAEPAPVVVSNVKVVSDKVKDVSSIEAWKKSYIDDKKTDRQKALACFETVVAHQHQETPPHEFLQQEGVILDPIKIFNVYGYSFCSVAAGELCALAQHVGLKARGWTINCHCVPEVFFDGKWALLDASLINYFPQADGSIASVEEICQSVQGWLKEHPELKGNDKALREFHFADQKTGWKRGPELLARCPFYNERGWWPAGTHGWYSTMQEYDGGSSDNKAKTPFDWLSTVSMGYRVNVQLREGERLTRNWSNKGLHVNMNKDGGTPGCLTGVVGKDALKYTPQYGDLAPGRIGNGTHEYAPTMESLTRSAYSIDNLSSPIPAHGQDILRVLDADKPGVLVVRMPSSYVYLTGEASISVTVGDKPVIVQFSDNNGLKWKDVAKLDKEGDHKLDLGKLVLRRYDYLLRFEVPAGATIGKLKISHDIQHSQRPLPALDKGDNKITFSASPDEGTVTIEGSYNKKHEGKNLLFTDFNPTVEGFGDNMTLAKGEKGTVVFPVQTPGEMVRLRLNASWRAWSPDDGVNFEVSFDDGKTYKALENFGKSDTFGMRYVEFKDVPPGAKSALVKVVALRKSSVQLSHSRISADYKQPGGGFRPVKVTYTWEEDGKPKVDEHVATKADEAWTIKCDSKPVMKSLVVELGEKK